LKIQEKQVTARPAKIKTRLTPRHFAKNCYFTRQTFVIDHPKSTGVFHLIRVHFHIELIAVGDEAAGRPAPAVSADQG